MRIKFDKGHFAVKQNNYLAKIVKVYIVCDLKRFGQTFYPEILQWKTVCVEQLI